MIATPMDKEENRYLRFTNNIKDIRIKFVENCLAVKSNAPRISVLELPMCRKKKHTIAITAIECLLKRT
jgi:hypothetical protein